MSWVADTSDTRSEFVNHWCWWPGFRSGRTLRSGIAPSVENATLRQLLTLDARTAALAGSSWESCVIIQLPDDLVAAVGRITIAAGDLELALAAIAVMRSGGNAFEILATPGEPMRAARRAIEIEPPIYKQAYRPAIAQAEELLKRRHSVVHAMWVPPFGEDSSIQWELLHYKTKVRHECTR